MTGDWERRKRHPHRCHHGDTVAGEVGKGKGNTGLVPKWGKHQIQHPQAA